MTDPITPRPVGWNTWDVQYHTGMSHLPTGRRVRFALAGADGSVADAFTWRHGLVRLGHHTVDGAYAQVTVAALGTTLELEFAGGGDVLEVTATVTGTGDLLLIVDRMPGVEPPSPGRGWTLALSTSLETSALDDIETLRVQVPAGRATPLTVRLAPAGTGPPARHRRRPPAGEPGDRLRTSGWLGDAGDAYVRSVTWNTIYAPDLGRVLTPTSRDFVCAGRDGFYRRWALHTWDTFFTGLVASWIDPQYARGIFAQILDQADARGMLPNRVSDDQGRTADRSQPPVGALTVMQAYLGSGLSDQTRDVSLLTSAYDGLRRWHEWWPAARRGPFGLLAWGSDPVPGDPESATMDRTRRESGLDDSPMYDEVSYDPATHTMDLADVGLNALHIADTEALATIADRLGDRPGAHELGGRLAAARAGFHQRLWDDTAGLYRNRWASGAFSPQVSPTLLYPLLAGAPTATQAQQLVAQLLDPDVLGGEPPLPSVARDDPGFSARYWRGRVWAPMVYLAVQGLRRYGFEDAASRITSSLLTRFLAEWDRHSHVRENYPVRPDEDVRPLPARSDGLMAWGSLLAYLAFGELADPRSGGWRFAHPGRPAALAGIPLAEGRLAVTAGDRLTVTLGGAPLIEADPHIVISGYCRRGDAVTGVATAHHRAGRFAIAPPATGTGAATVELQMAGATTAHSAHAGQLIPLEVTTPGVPVAFRVTRPANQREKQSN